MYMFTDECTLVFTLKGVVTVDTNECATHIAFIYSWLSCYECFVIGPFSIIQFLSPAVLSFNPSTYDGDYRYPDTFVFL